MELYYGQTSVMQTLDYPNFSIIWTCLSGPIFKLNID